MTSKATNTIQPQQSTVSPVPSSIRRSSLSSSLSSSFQPSDKGNHPHKEKEEHRPSIISPEINGTKLKQNISVDISVDVNNSMKKKKVVIDRWVCDICQTQAFDTFEEACKHEEICRGVSTQDAAKNVQEQKHAKKENSDATSLPMNESRGNRAARVSNASDVNVDASEIHDIQKSNEKSGSATSVSFSQDEVEMHMEQKDESELDFEETPILPKRLQFQATSNEKEVQINSESSADGDANDTSVSMDKANTTKEITPTQSMTMPSKPYVYDFNCHFDNCEICGTHPTKETKINNTNANAVAKKTRSKSKSTSPSNNDTSSSSVVVLSDSSPEVQIVATARTKQTRAKSKSKAIKAPTAPLFLNKQSKKGLASTSNKSKSSMAIRKGKIKQSNDGNTNSTSKTPRTMAFAAIFQKPDANHKSKSSSSGLPTLSAKTESPSSATTPNSATEKNTNMMISEEERKAILAEHRAAEFASKRRLKQQEERERQVKREEMRRSQYEAKQQKKEERRIQQQQQEQQRRRQRHLKDVSMDVDVELGTGANGGNKGVKGKVASIFQPHSQLRLQSDVSSKRRKITSSRGSTESPVDLTGSQSPLPAIPDCLPSLQSQLEILKAKQKQKKGPHDQNHVNDWKLYPPRFPNPSHVLADSSGVGDGVEFGGETSSYGDSKEYEKFVSVSRYQQSKNSISPSNVPPSPYSFERQTTDDNTNAFESEEADFLFRSFSSVLQPCSASLDADNQLWSDKYSMKSLPHDVYGHTNKEVSTDLINFVNDWKGHRQRICDIRAEKAAKLQGRRKKKKSKKTKRYESDDDGFYSDDDDGGLRNVYLLTGVTGSGKTSLVRATAKHCNCILIEINTTMERGGRALKKEIEECTQSLSNLASRKNQTGGVLQEDEDGGSPDPSLAVILIDEVDILFESDGDQGFWHSLSSVAKKAMCPIILTASTLPPQLEDSSSIRYLHSRLVRPKPFECVSKITQISRMEGMRWKKDLEPNELKSRLAYIAKYCSCDIRRIMNEMQLFGLGNSLSRKSDVLAPLSLPLHSNPENFTRRLCPEIESVSPDVVQSHSNTVIMLKGKHFSTDATIEIMVGNQLCPATRIMNDSTVIAVVPPCQIPKDIDGFGYRKSTLTESLSTRFAPVSMIMKDPNGYTIRSDSTKSTQSTEIDQDTSSKIFLEYTFPEDTFVEMKFQDPSGETPEELISKGARNFIDDLEMTEQNTALKTKSPIVSCTPLSQYKDSLDQMLDMSKHFEILSDCILQSDTNEQFALPQLAGAMNGFDETGASDISTLDLCGWGSEDYGKGSSDAFMTMPTSRRDRMLISTQLCSTRQSLSLNTEAVLNTAHESDEHTDPIFCGPRSSEEETYIAFQNYNRSNMLPNEIFDAKKYGSVCSRAANVGIQEWDEISARHTTIELSETLFSETRFVRNFSPEYFQLEYFPFLRQMAHIESIYDKNYAALKLQDKGSDDFKKRRRTTRSKKKDERIHYLDLILDSRILDENEGKAIGEELAKTMLHSTLI